MPNLPLISHKFHQVTRTESFEILKANNPVFFVYIGKQQGVLWEFYYMASEANQQFAYFYATNTEVGGKHFIVDSSPVVLVYKESTHYIFPLSDAFDAVDPSALNASMHTWIVQEKFLTFPRVTRENLHQLRQTRKFLVIAVVEENRLAELETHEQEFRDMVEQLVRTKRSKFHDRFQFGWTGVPDLAHTIAMQHLPTPHLLVLNSTTNHHHVPDDDPLQMTPEAIEVFLETIANQTATVYGGDHYSVRVYRAFFETRRILREMWKGNPILCFILFVVPFGFFMIILYSIFCADIMDAEDGDDDHEKKE
jgi:thioredoxin domain-containing protein 10